MDKMKEKIDRTLSSANKRLTTRDQSLNLNLYNHSIDREGFRYLLSKLEESKATVKSLVLNQNSLGDEGCEELLNPIFERLQNVDLTSIGIRELGAKILADTPWHGLKILNLTNNKIGPDGLVNLCKAPWLETVQQLFLANNKIGDDGLVGFIDKKFQQLKELYLTNNEISTEGIMNLSRAQFPELKTLNLGKNNITDESCAVLITLSLPKLSLLHLNENQIGQVGAGALSKGKWAELTLLYLAKNQIGDVGCKKLKVGNWKKLSWLCLSGNGLGDNGLKWIAKANWPNLQTLRLQNNFQQRGMKAFSQANFPKLKTLLFEFSKCKSEINKELIKCNFPELKKCKVYDQSRYFYYRYRDQGENHIEDKEFWNEQFAAAFLNVEF